MSTRRAFTFWGTVGAVWTALKLKKEYDDYRTVSTEDDPEPGRIHLPNTPLPREGGNGEDDVSLLDTNIRVRRQTKKPAGCCVCCGVDCTLFWKAFAFVLALWSLFGLYKVARWALTPTPSGLEGMPVFGEALGCDHASTFYQDARDGYPLNATVPHGSHHIKLMGSGVGTLTVTTAPSDATEIQYNIIMKGTDKPLLDLAKIELTETKFGSTLEFDTPSISKVDLQTGNKCVRFDIVLAVPPNLKELYIRGYSTLQVKFDDSVHFDLSRFSVMLFGKEMKNMILPTSNLHASDNNYLEVFNGWIVGDVTVSTETIINTQRADGVANVKIYPASVEEAGENKRAILRTATGSGRSDFFYITDKSSKKRPISSHHISARNGDVYLHYEQADFNGKIAMSSRSSTIHGSVANLRPLSPRPRPPVTKREQAEEWTHTRGNAEGGDKLWVESNGWTGLWF